MMQHKQLVLTYSPMYSLRVGVKVILLFIFGVHFILRINALRFNESIDDIVPPVLHRLSLSEIPNTILSAEIVPDSLICEGFIIAFKYRRSFYIIETPWRKQVQTLLLFCVLRGVRRIFRAIDDRFPRKCPSYCKSDRHVKGKPQTVHCDEERNFCLMKHQRNVFIFCLQKKSIKMAGGTSQ